jgi:hypothetical protein
MVRTSVPKRRETNGREKSPFAPRKAGLSRSERRQWISCGAFRACAHHNRWRIATRADRARIIHDLTLRGRRFHHAERDAYGASRCAGGHFITRSVMPTVACMDRLPTWGTGTNIHYSIVPGERRLHKLYKDKIFLVSADERRWRNMRSDWTSVGKHFSGCNRQLQGATGSRPIAFIACPSRAIRLGTREIACLGSNHPFTIAK